MTHETRLLSELLDPMKEAIQTYRALSSRSLDQVTACTEQAHQDIEDIPASAGYRALERLAQVAQLGGDPRAELDSSFAEIANGPDLFPANSRRAVESELRERPQPPDCP